MMDLIRDSAHGKTIITICSDKRKLNQLNNKVMKEQMSYVMRMAWFIAKETGTSISYGLKQAWKNFKLQLALKKEVVSFTYLKISGGIRTAKGTLCGDFVPGGFSASGTTRKQNDGVLCYYDMVKNGWRSFRKANLVSVTL